MNLVSGQFASFILLGAVIYWSLASRYRKYWLIALSIMFSLSWNWQATLALLLVSLLNYWLARYSIRSKFLWPIGLGIAINIGAFFFFKYAGYFIASLQSFTGLNHETLRLMAPIGISFYSLQGISYLIDVGQRKKEVLSNFGDVFLFLGYFPKFLSGPLERVRDFVPRLESKNKLNPEHLKQAAGLLVLGLIRKIFIADNLFALIPEGVFWNQQAGLITWILAYSFALYNDFAGYTNLMRGVSLLFGIELSRNFNLPFFARNFTEFWNRWHASLSHWLRDYVFFPIRRVLLKKLPSTSAFLQFSLPPLITMLVSGLWHGSAEGGIAHMLLWGGLHGLYQVFELLPNLWRRPTRVMDRPRYIQNINRISVFTLVSLAWVPFQVGISASFSVWKSLLNPALWWANVVQIWFFLLIALSIDLLQNHKSEELFFKNWSPWRQAFASATLILLLFVSIKAGRTPFVYAGF